MNDWPKVRLGEVLKIYDTSVPVNELSEINLAGVYSFGRGLFKRGPMFPAKTTYKSYNRLFTDDFVISIPKAWEGALARVTPEFEGWYLSPVFPTFRTDPDNLLPAFLEWFCKRESVWTELQSKSRGIGARRESVHPKQFLSLEIPLPPLVVQRRIVTNIEELAAQINEASFLRQRTKVQVEALYAAKLRATILECGSKVRYLPFTEVVQLERRPISIELDKNYQEIGVYCFGRGIFHKPPRTGAEIGTKDLYEVHSGDFILQITFAWEGAVALANNCDDGLLGSVRYLTFRVNEEMCSPLYLLTYMKTPEVIAKLAKISPGSAGRNRVLSAKRLDEILIPIIPLSNQIWLTKELEGEVDMLKRLQAETAAELDALLPDILDRAFRGDLL